VRFPCKDLTFLAIGMGYFKRKLHRQTARLERLAFFEPAREICAKDWRHCDLTSEPAAAFLRFVVDHPADGRIGLFKSSDLVEEAEDLPASARSVLRELFRWFNANLPVPRRLPRNAVCWFRSDATSSLERLRKLIEVYRLMGVQVWMRATQTPGRVVYRDAYQVAAVPYRDRRVTSSVM
jgi:hypothetical protein